MVPCQDSVISVLRASPVFKGTLRVLKRVMAFTPTQWLGLPRPAVPIVSNVMDSAEIQAHSHRMCFESFKTDGDQWWS